MTRSRTTRRAVRTPSGPLGGFLGILIGGVLSGFFLGGLLWLVDRVAALGLLQLLLDDSFLPVIGPGSGLLVEWFLHLLTSVAVYSLLVFVIRRLAPARPLLWGGLLGAVTSLVYLPLSQVSAAVLRPGWETPVVWLLAHIAWGVLVGLLDRFLSRR